MEPQMTVAAKKPQRAKITEGKRAGRATGAVPESPKVKSWGPTPAACAVTPAAECEATGTPGLLHYLLKYVQLQGCSFESPSSSRLHSKSLWAPGPAPKVSGAQNCQYQRRCLVPAG